MGSKLPLSSLSLPHRASFPPKGYIRLPDSSDSDETPSSNMKLDLISRRRKNLSASSTSLSPTGPTLESPATFQVSAGRAAVPDATLRAKDKPEGVIAMPSMFQDDDNEDEEKMMNDVTRGTPADPSTVAVVQRGPEEEEAPQFHAQHYEDAFGTRGLNNSPKDRLIQESIVAIELKVNTHIRDDESLASDITNRMANIYQKLESSILVTVQQDACILFGNKPSPAYFMKVMALPSLIAPVTNLRTTILIQSALHTLLSIAPSRGVVVYVPVPEENFATNGVTAMGEIRNMERRVQDDEPGIFKTISRGMSRRLKSNSGSSRPLSFGTTSSLMNVTEPEASSPKPAGETSSQCGSKGEDQPRAIKKRRSVKEIITRGLSEMGSLGPMYGA